jgi:aminopeptidase
MRDPRLQKLAQVVVRYSLDIQPGDKLRIRCPVLAAPLVKEVYREAIRAGAHVHTRLALEDLNEIALREASDEQLTYVSELAQHEMEYFTADLYIWAETNTKHLTGVDPNRLALAQKAHAPITKRFLERIATKELRWCGTLFPTQASAQDAGMSLSDYEDFVFDAGHLNEPDPLPESARRNPHCCAGNGHHLSGGRAHLDQLRGPGKLPGWRGLYRAD